MSVKKKFISKSYGIEKSLILDSAEIVKSPNFVPIQKIAKKIKKYIYNLISKDISI
jgi:hypothetical protein